MRNGRVIVLLAVILAASALFAQEQPPAPTPQPPAQQQQQPPPQPAPQTPPQPAPQPAPQPQPQPAPQPAPETQAQPAPQPAQPQPAAQEQPPTILSGAASGAYERRESFPYFNLYLPEGQASVRLRKLIKNVLFESQIDYRFINGDISTFLRYKYYAHEYTYKIGVFDTIGFPDVGKGSTQEFERVRGGLLLLEFPRNYNNRYYWLTQDDRLTFGDLTRVDNRKNNIYMKFGYQYGTQFDDHLNAIVGETRGRIIPVLTAFRDLGPQKTSFAAALTESAKISTGDYHYTKLEAEALRRWDVTPTSFLVVRAHIGAFPTKSLVREWCTDPTNQTCGKGTPPPGAIIVPSIERYSVPAYDMFVLGGREALKSIGASDAATGTSEFHITNEYFLPVFRNRDYSTGPLHWNTLYGIGYVGAGNVGYQLNDAAKFRNYVADAGIGTEASLTVRDFDVLFSVLYAHTVRSVEGLSGSKVRFSIRTIR